MSFRRARTNKNPIENPARSKANMFLCTMFPSGRGVKPEIQKYAMINQTRELAGQFNLWPKIEGILQPRNSSLEATLFY